MLKKSLFFIEEFSNITHFTADRYSQHDALRLFDLSTWGQIHNVIGRGLIIGWPSIQRGEDSEEIADTCVWPENGLLVDIKTTTVIQTQPHVKWGRCNGIHFLRQIFHRELFRSFLYQCLEFWGHSNYAAREYYPLRLSFWNKSNFFIINNPAPSWDSGRDTKSIFNEAQLVWFHWFMLKPVTIPRQKNPVCYTMLAYLKEEKINP